MIIGVLGDIHGNDEALKSVLIEAKKLQVEKLLITGDFVGYYYNVEETLEMLKEWNWTAVRGNHEDMMSECLRNKNKLKAIEKKYGSGLRRTIDKLSIKNINNLINLPHPLEVKIGQIKILLCHGSPWDNNYYVYPDAPNEVLNKCAIDKYDLVIMGHTHYQMSKLIKSTLILNPGSVGQARDKPLGAKWATFDTSTKEIKLKIQKYNTGKIIDKINKFDPQIKYLSKILDKK